MFRLVSTIYFRNKVIEFVSTTRKDVFKLSRAALQSSAPCANQTVLTTHTTRTEDFKQHGSSQQHPATPPPSSPTPPPLPPPSGSTRHSWTLAAALAITASVGGVYLYRKLSDEQQQKQSKNADSVPETKLELEPQPIPNNGDVFPSHVQYLVVGGGTAAFAGMRAIRSARPTASVLLVSDEDIPPYMRPPLSKELWREPSLPPDPQILTFRQWNGRRRSVLYEPNAFYTPVEDLAVGEAGKGGGAALARGWRVTRLDVERHEARLEAPGCEPVTVRYDRCLLATGSRPARLPVVEAAARAGRSLTLRTVRDAMRLAALLDQSTVQRVAIIGGGFLASELSAALAERFQERDKSVVQIYREQAPMEHVLPEYLAADAGRRLQEIGVQLLPRTEVVGAEVEGDEVRLALAGGAIVPVQLVVECVGSEPNVELAAAAGLELHPEHGGVVVNAEMQARTDVYAAGDVACYHDVVLGRRRVEHHDHAAASGRRAGENMAAVDPPRAYTHQGMFWSDLGPKLGYEAIGIVDSRLPTVGVFSEDAVLEGPSAVESGDEAARRRYERGVVYYLRDKRVVGILLWNLFNRMHIARQVLRVGEFEDLFEVSKLLELHEDEPEAETEAETEVEVQASETPA